MYIGNRNIKRLLKKVKEPELKEKLTENEVKRRGENLRLDLIYYNELHEKKVWIFKYISKFAKNEKRTEVYHNYLNLISRVADENDESFSVSDVKKFFIHRRNFFFKNNLDDVLISIIYNFLATADAETEHPTINKN
jgi:hypothetical protein